MPSPVTPNQWKSLITGVSSNFCEKFNRLLELLAYYCYLEHAYKYTEDGNFTDEYKADVCALGCVGGDTTGGGTVDGLGLSTVTASDDTYSDRIAVTWTAVLDATKYDLYRSTSNSFSGASKIGTALTTLAYTDNAVTPGTVYYYWIYAYNDTQSSTSYSNSGRASTLAGAIVNASDGDYASKIVIRWTAVADATSYELLRGTTTARESAASIANPLVALSYEDSDVVAGTTYYYWVRAYNSTQSTDSTYDAGHAGSLPEDLVAITDLQAGQGLYIDTVTPVIPLVWSPVTGADAYDIYVGEVDDPAQATPVRTNGIPFDSSRSQGYFGEAGQDRFYHNQTEMLYWYTPPASALNATYYRKYYFWVKAKRIGTSPAVSAFSNSNAGALGWACGDGSGGAWITNGHLTNGNSFTVSAGGIRLWLALYGAGANGAGSGMVYGGGGGGGGALITGSYACVTGSKIRLVHVPSSIAARAAEATSGDAGPLTKVEYSELGDWSDTIILAAGGAPGGGLYNVAGAGAGGAGGAASGSVLLSDSTVYEGRAGMPGAGTRGGMSGCTWGNPRIAAAHFNNSLSWIGDGEAGSGADASISALARTGGRGQFGNLLFVLYAS